MKTVSVNTSKKYDILIGCDLLPSLGAHLLPALGKPCKIAIISDSNVWPLYGSTAENALKKAGFETVTFVFPAGESSKNADTYLQVLNFLAENKITRADALVALGGGVTGDMTGFAAATYLRGIRYIQVPTSLLAMVDSSVGGKTAIDLPAGKNLVGAFHQPSLVLCDMKTLDTLPAPVFSDGCAEVIKYAVLYDPELFAHLSECGIAFDREAVIARCVTLKRDVVCEDEFDTGVRQKLNLGHTVGHSIELQSDFTITHGQAVAIGMAIVAKATCKPIHTELCRVLEAFNLPIETRYSAAQLAANALSDKKRSGATVNLVIPRRIGFCEIVPTPVNTLESFIKEGL